VNTKNAIEILTPSPIPDAPNPKTKNPMATSNNPKPYLNAAEGLYFDSHNLETVDANAIIKNEFNVENHETVISDASLENSFLSIHKAAPQINTKHEINTMFDKAIFFHVANASFTNTHEIIANGTIVNNPFTILNVVKAVPVKLLSI